MEVGCREEGRGANSAPEKPPPPTRQTGPRFLSKDFLRPDRQRAMGPPREKAHHIRGKCAQASGCLSGSPRREKVRCTWGEGAQASDCLGHSPRREKARQTWGEWAQASGCLSCSPRREKAHRIWGEGAQASGCLNRSGRGRHKTQVATKSALLWSTRKLELPSTQGPLHTEQPRD